MSGRNASKRNKFQWGFLNRGLPLYNHSGSLRFNSRPEISQLHFGFVSDKSVRYALIIYSISTLLEMCIQVQKDIPVLLITLRHFTKLNTKIHSAYQIIYNYGLHRRKSFKIVRNLGWEQDTDHLMSKYLITQLQGLFVYLDQLSQQLWTISGYGPRRAYRWNFQMSSRKLHYQQQDSNPRLSDSFRYDMECVYH